MTPGERRKAKLARRAKRKPRRERNARAARAAENARIRAAREGRTPEQEAAERQLIDDILQGTQRFTGHQK